MASLIPLPFLVLTVSLLLRAELRGQKQQVYLLKPLSTLLVIAVALLAFRAPGGMPRYTLWLTAGLVLSLGGDVALMFQERQAAFLAGLVLFLLAHVTYSLAFTLTGGFHPADWMPGAALAVVGVAAYLYLWPGLGNMKLPVALYVLVIAFMVSRAISTFFSPAFTQTQAWIIAWGATLFFLSDLLLALHRFRVKRKWHRANLALYYAGQFLIAFSASFFAVGG